MNKQLTLLLSFLLLSFIAKAQVYTMEDGNVTTCSGTFYDSGGAIGNYDANESYIYTICSDSPAPNSQIQVNFTSFDVQDNVDFLYVYDGPDTSLAPIAALTGDEATPAIFQSSNGCLTFEFISDGSSNSAGWQADVSCYVPCQTIVGTIEETIPEAVIKANNETVVEICQGETVTFTGSATFSDSDAGTTYQWVFGEDDVVEGLTAQYTYNEGGVYVARFEVTDPNGCGTTNVVEQIVHVSTTPTISLGSTSSEICLGETATLTALATPQEAVYEFAPPVGETVFLPDGDGISYETTIIVSGYSNSATLSATNILESVCINMEHSYLGDLEIELISPTGESIILKSEEEDGGGTYLGQALDDGTLNPGVGFDYCFSASGSTTLVNGPTVAVGGPTPGSAIAEGTYLPSEAISNLEGSPINGEWKLRVTDNLPIDNGYIFSWSLNFDVGDLPENYTYTPVFTQESWSTDANVIENNGNEITIQPTAEGEYCYTYSVEDTFGCVYQQQICVTVNPLPEAFQPEDYILCGEVEGEGYATFDLTTRTADILGAQTGYIVEYYSSEAEATYAINQINPANNYQNEDEEQQVIYARVEDEETGCFALTSFTIFANILPEATAPEDLYICDDGGGTVTVDLASQLIEALGTQNADDFVATAYTSEAEALAGDNPITSFSLPTGDVATLFIRVENAINSECFTTTSFGINTFSTPVINQPADIVECQPEDLEIASFDTSGVTESIIGDMEGVSIQYFDEAGNLIGDELPNPYESASQTITANVTDSYPVCYEFHENDFTLNGNAQMQSDGETIRLTPNQSGQNGSAWADIMLDLSEDFTVESELYFGSNESGADGMAFVIQPLSVNAGSLGGGLGFAGISPSLAVEFDTYDNGTNTDPISNDHIALIQDGNPQNVAAHSAIVPYYDAGNLEDGAWHSAIFHWDVEAQTFTVTFDGVVIINADIDITNDVFEGSPYVYWGFTGATGAAYNLQQVRVQDYCVAQEDIGCTASVQFDLVASHALEVAPLDPIEACDDPSNDGFSTFDLTQLEPTIFNGYEDDFSISYYLSEAAAEASENAISNPANYTNGTVDGETIYIRLDNNETYCYTIASFDIVVHPVPEVLVPYPYYGCDQDEDGYYDYDLPSMNAELLNGQTNISVTYYETLADAEDAVDVLPDVYTNTQTPDQTIYARLENTITGCYNTTSLELKIAELPETLSAGSLEECDIDHDGFAEFDIESINNGILPNNGQDYYITYHETYQDAEDGVNTIASLYQNITPDQQTVYIRVEHAVSGCYSIEPLELIVNPTPPNDITLDALTYCDPDNDGFGSFDIESVAADAIPDANATYGVTFHETYIDATTGTNELSSMYDNIVPYQQTIYIRLTWSVNSCASVIPFDLIVLDTPVIAANLPALEICDDSVVDGLAEFDLTLQNDAVYEDQSTSDFSISYYQTETDAILGEDALPMNFTNAVPYAQTIYVRLENNITGCFTVRAFELLVHENPVINPDYDYDLALCDDFGEEGDETLVFDLTAEKVEITGNVDGYSVHFFETMADAENNVNEIPDDTAYTNYANPQNLYVRVVDVITGCTSFTTVTLRVLNNPTPLSDMEPMEACDDDLDGDENNGQVVFDLTQDELALLNGETGVSATYYETYDDAFEGINAITNPSAYYNISAYNQTIYVGVTNDVTGCLTIVDFDLIVNPLPEVTDAEFYYACELDNDLIERIVLSDMDSFVVAGGSLDGLEVSYYATEAAAEAGYPAIVGPYVTVNETMEIYARVENLETGCAQVVGYTIDIEQAPLAATPEPYALCESLTADGYYNNDGIEVFDLMSLEATILMGQDPNGYTVTFYESYDDALGQISAIPDEEAEAYESASTFVYAVVTNDATGCTNGEPIEIELVVEPMPEVTLEVVNDGVVCIDATNNPVIGTDLGYGYTYEWSNGETTPTIEVTQGGEYYVTITASESINQCSYTSNTVTYEEASLPSVTPTIIQSEIFSENNTIQVVANGAGSSVYEYQLDDNPAQNSNVFTNVAPGVHTVTIIEVNGCGSLAIEVSVIDYMKYFTPNGDGVNDKWRIIGLESQENAQVFIFDRQGKLLKQMSATSDGWDGRYNGAIMTSTDYWFKVVYTEPSTGTVKEFQSHFSLKR